MKRLILGISLLPALAFAGTNDKLEKVLAGDHRSDENKARDTYRHPAETLAFFGLVDDMTVIELYPSKGWYTEILAPYLKDKGQLVAALYDPATSEKWGDWMRKNNQEFKDRFVANADTFGKIKAAVFSVPGNASFGIDDGTADMILDLRNAHNWIQNDPAAFVKACHAALKQGGIYGIIDHRMDADKPYDPKNGYVHEKQIIELFEANGFKLAGQTDINKNPKDTKDHARGVWTLPPTLALGDQDKEKYLAIGESDRLTMKFVKQ